MWMRGALPAAPGAYAGLGTHVGVTCKITTAITMGYMLIMML
jgi:hypothetical protein